LIFANLRAYHPEHGITHSSDRPLIATRLIHRVCCLAGEPDLIDEIRTDNGAIRSAIKKHDTPALFDWLMATLSYQGISDRVAYYYMEQHGRVTWREIERDFASQPSCPKLQSYWQFYGCRYHKTSQTCAEPDHIARCPLPTHNLRNGRLNQTAYSLFLFISTQIDARQFNPRFPKTFPRFVQHAIWRYCAGNGLEVCNGNRINDDASCDNVYCQVHRMCDRTALRKGQ
jgi:hypothetical protein